MNATIEFKILRANLEKLKKERLPQKNAAIALGRPLLRLWVAHSEQLQQHLSSAVLRLLPLLEAKARLKNHFAGCHHSRLIHLLQNHLSKQVPIFLLQISREAKIQRLPRPNVFALRQPLNVLAEPMARLRKNISYMSEAMILHLRAALRDAIAASPSDPISESKKSSRQNRDAQK